MKAFIIGITILVSSLLVHGQNQDINKLDVNGKRTGLWISHYPGGEIKYRGQFFEGNPVDTLERYYENGNRKAIMITNPDTELYSARLFDQEGILRASGSYLNQRKHGLWFFYNISGKVLMEINYQQDTVEGVAKRYFASGDIMEKTSWINNELSGQQIIYNESGKKSAEISYKFGKMNGIFKTYNSFGFMSTYGKYNNGLKEGKWQYFDEKGQAEFQLQYESGILLNPEIMDSLQKISFDQYERNRTLLKDPKNYFDDPFSYIRNKN